MTLFDILQNGKDKKFFRTEIGSKIRHFWSGKELLEFLYSNMSVGDDSCRRDGPCTPGLPGSGWRGEWRPVVPPSSSFAKGQSCANNSRERTCLGRKGRTKWTVARHIIDTSRDLFLSFGWRIHLSVLVTGETRDRQKSWLSLKDRGGQRPVPPADSTTCLWSRP